MKIAKCAKKALSLRKDLVFRLLVVMTILLGILAATGAASYNVLSNVYSSWKLEQESQINIYLLSSVDEAQAAYLEEEISHIEGVHHISRLSNEDISLLLQPYFTGEEAFPLPKVLVADVSPSIDRRTFDETVKNIAPDAEIDDARTLLQTAANAISMAKTAIICAAACLFTMMLLLVTLTVRAGLRGHRLSLSVMQHIGATETFIASLVVRQVMKQSLLGWGGAVLITHIGLAITQATPNILAPYISGSTYAYAGIAPLTLVALAFVASYTTCKHITRTSQGKGV